jgi:hypothetical protein
MVTFISGPCLFEILLGLRLDYKENGTAIQPFSDGLKHPGITLYQSSRSMEGRLGSIKGEEWRVV